MNNTDIQRLIKERDDAVKMASLYEKGKVMTSGIAAMIDEQTAPLKAEIERLKQEREEVLGNLLAVEDREARTVEALTAACIERDEARALLADSPTAAARQVSAALRERDEARAEVERLRRDYSALLESYEAQKFGEATVRRIVAERQREECANYLHVWRYDPSKGARGWDECDAVRAAPLVTEGEP